ncbi:MAG TPA: site-specific integrase [Microbacteriaceae bacterium]
MAAKRKPRESFGAIRARGKTVQASYVGPDGKRYYAPHTFDNATDARGWLARQRITIADGKWSATTAETASISKATAADALGDYATEWLQTRTNRHGEGLRPRTRVEYERLLAGPLSTLTGGRISIITPSMIRTWYSAQLDTNKQTQAARAYGLLKSILATAVQDGRIATNPCMIRGAQNATTGKRVEPPTSAELQKILDAITPRYKAAVLIAAWAGCRYGELTELRRKDVRILKNGRAVDAIIIDVARAVTHTTGIGFTVGKTKSAAGVRSIALPPHIFPEIIAHLKDRTGAFPESLLFPAADGMTHLAESSFVKHWYPAREKAKRTDLPFHALRHYGATKFAQTGATLKEIQERLGHSTVSAAMRYQHSAGRDAELARRMSDLS